MHNPEIELALEFVQNTNRNIFLTGKAGTGKTTFLHQLKDVLPKRMVVVAPTGVAAINAGGVTIHSFFQMPFSPIVPGGLTNISKNQGEKSNFKKFNKKKIDLIRTLDLLVIDEISMVRADLMDGIDQVLRRYKDKRLPFGGIQVLMIGDLQQLAPIAKQDEWEILRQFYDSIYFFSSKVFQEARIVGIELKHIYRQQDNDFISLLNEIRDNQLSKKSFDLLNSRYKPNFIPDNKERYITLTTHNETANKINSDKLKTIKKTESTFEAEVEGLFPEYSFPTDMLLKLKVGAQVMFIKNDSSYLKRYFNGKIGTITGFEDDKIIVQCPEDNEPIEVEKDIWENIRYSIHPETKAIEEENTGTFIQYPLRLAWAITIHKSQGLTFDRAVIDAQAAFAHGQTYVALSRCRTLEGLILRSKISKHAIITDQTVGVFNQTIHNNPPDENILTLSKNEYIINLLTDLFSFRQIGYYLDKGIKQIYMNESIIDGDIHDQFNKMNQEGVKVLDEVAQKFAKQLKYISQTQNDTDLQERIIKGGKYFLDQSRLYISAPLKKVRFETDNTLVKKEINEVLNKINELLYVKQCGFKKIQNGFNIKEYLEDRAIAMLEKPYQKKRAKEAVVTKNQNLFTILKDWRNTLSRDKNKPVYFILPYKSMVDIANALPVTFNQLKIIKGIGKKKLEVYGDDIISIVIKYCLENKINLNKDKKKEIKKKPKQSTKLISKLLWEKGKSIKEITIERELKQSTIEGHLAYFVGRGEIDIEQIVDSKKLKTIKSFIVKNPEASLSFIKENIGVTVLWSEIRFVIQHVNYINKK